MTKYTTLVLQLNTAEGRAAVGLLRRFFEEENFDTPFGRIEASLEAMLGDRNCWVALALADGQAVGVITVTTMLYVEWGRLGEIGDLYVLPQWRGQGLAAKLVVAATGWCRSQGCSAVSVVVTPESEQRYGLTKFYQGQQFDASGRTIMTRRL